VDSHENRDTAEGLMNLHNNEAGRRVSILGRQISCTCLTETSAPSVPFLFLYAFSLKLGS
jgi:hypothetical protein